MKEERLLHSCLSLSQKKHSEWLKFFLISLKIPESFWVFESSLSKVLKKLLKNWDELQKKQKNKFLNKIGCKILKYWN